MKKVGLSKDTGHEMLPVSFLSYPQPASDPASYDIYYEITVKGSTPTQMIEGSPTAIINPGKNVTPRIRNVSNGPVEVKTWKSDIDSGTGLQKKAMSRQWQRVDISATMP